MKATDAMGMAPLLVGLVVVCLNMCSGSEDSEWSSVQYANVAGDMLSRSCMYGFGIFRLFSKYDKSKQDRLWRLGCRKVPHNADPICMWTYNYVNEPGQDVKYECEDNYYIAGLYSEIPDNHTNRVWRVECCHSPGVLLANCVETVWMNRAHGDLYFTVQDNYTLHGIYAVHDFNKSDDIWSYIICDMVFEDGTAPPPRKRYKSGFNEIFEGDHKNNF